MDFKSDFVSPQQEGSRPNSPPKQRGGKIWHPETSRLLAAGAGATTSKAVQLPPSCLSPVPGLFQELGWMEGEESHGRYRRSPWKLLQLLLSLAHPPPLSTASLSSTSNS